MMLRYESRLDPAPRTVRRWRQRWAVMAALGVAGVALAGAMLMPSVPRCGPSADQVRCASNLKQIEMAIGLYAAAHGGAMPDSLATLLRHEDLVPEVFVCPNDRAASIASSVETFNIYANTSYTYLGDGLRGPIERPGEVVLAIERRPHGGRMMLALFADGRIEWYASALAIGRQVADGVRPVRWPAAAATAPTTMAAP